MDEEFERELLELKQNGLKNNPLRLEYEEKVKSLSEYRDELLAQGVSESELAKLLYHQRRELGKRYKDAAPPLFREYIFYATEKKYGDPLGPAYEALRKNKTDAQIIESSTRPIGNLDDRLTIDGFINWYKGVKMEEKTKKNLTEEETETVSGGGFSDITEWLKKSANQVKNTYKCEECGRIYTASTIQEAEQYKTLGKHLCALCKAKL